MYRFNFKRDDFVSMAGALGGVKGKFLLYLNDHKEIRRIFSIFRIQEVTTKYSAMKGNDSARAQVHKELLIRNYSWRDMDGSVPSSR